MADPIWCEWEGQNYEANRFARSGRGWVHLKTRPLHYSNGKRVHPAPTPGPLAIRVVMHTIPRRARRKLRQELQARGMQVALAGMRSGGKAGKRSGKRRQRRK